MKATKKIVGAACALVAAVALSAGTTFAWFATNNTVTATGLSINVNAKSTYLLIGGSTEAGANLGETANNIQALVTTVNPNGGQTTAFTISNANVFPSAHASITYKNSSNEDTTYTDQITNATSAAVYSNWYTAGSDNATTGAINKTGPVAIDSEKNFSKYVIKQTVYLTVADGTTTTGAINVGFTKESDGSTSTFVSSAQNAPVTILLACGDTVIEYKWDTGTSQHKWSSTTITTGVSSTVATQIDIYLYYDGNNPAVNTNNAANLTGESFGLTFTATDGI